MSELLKLAVTREEAILFCEIALRNVDILRLSEDDLTDIADALTSFRRAALRATEHPHD